MVDGLGINRSRLALLIALHARGGSATSPQLMDDTGISSQMASRHLRQMEKMGLLRAGRDEPRKGGPAVTWTVDYDVLRSEWEAVARQILPED